MAEDGAKMEVEAEVPAEEVAGEEAAPVVEEKKEEEAPLTLEGALQKVLKTSLYNDGLARGLSECVKALDRRNAHLCVISSKVDEEAYTKLITALCDLHRIPLIKAEDSKTLGEWAGLCKYNEEGNAVKVVACGCVVVKSWGADTAARQMVLNHIKG